MSSPEPGWYPDPGGESDRYRYWDGAAWSAALSDNPDAQPPFSVGGGLGARPLGRDASGADEGAAKDDPPARRGLPVDALVGLIVATLVIGLVVYGVINASSGGKLPGPGGGSRPGQQTTQDVCPRQKVSYSPGVKVSDGRVRGGKISFPYQPSPWSSPQPDDRVPFGSDVWEQIVVTEPNYTAGSNWVAALVVAELVAGDGFYTPREGASIVAQCVLGTFYGDNTINRTDRDSRALTVGGHEAWLLELHLTFDIRNLKEKGETALIVVVNNGGMTASLYYASIPDSRPDLLKTARDIIPQLTIDR